MNGAQDLWWAQAKSDLELFIHLRKAGVHECHLLHYLQMATEKLSKAYLWRSGNPPPRSHTGFVRFLKALLDRSSADVERIAETLGFRHAAGLEDWVMKTQDLAYSLQRMAPAEAQNGPNPEYPWPHRAPAECPATHHFQLWNELSATGRGRKMIAIIERAIRVFDQYA